jgi:heat shock protein HslJ
MRNTSLILLVALVLGCNPKPEPPPAAADSTVMQPPAMALIVDRDWTLTQLGDNTSPLGNGGKQVTLRLTSAENRAGGNAGCNGYGAPYTLSGNQLTFGMAISTKMACEQGMDVETAFLSMLPKVTSYQASDSSLTLSGPAGTLAHFR